MKKIIVFYLPLLIVAIFIISCNQCIECSDNNDYVKKENQIAKAEKIKGLYVFIKTEPVTDFETLGTIQNDFLDQVSSETKGKKIKGVIKDIFNTTNNNIDFQKLLDHMIDLSKETYQNADGLIFRNNLSSCEAIKFK